jgi:hypothetical protein
VLLRLGARLVDCFAALASAFAELLALVLDLGVETVENREDSALQLLRGFVVLVGNGLDSLAWIRVWSAFPYLSVRPDVLEHARNTSKRLVEVVAFLQRVLNRLSLLSILPTNTLRSSYLQHPLILLSVRMVGLLGSGYIVLKVCNGMLPGLQSLRKELRDLRKRSATVYAVSRATHLGSILAWNGVVFSRAVRERVRWQLAGCRLRNRHVFVGMSRLVVESCDAPSAAEKVEIKLLWYSSCLEPRLAGLAPIVMQVI